MSEYSSWVCQESDGCDGGDEGSNGGRLLAQSAVALYCARSGRLQLTEGCPTPLPRAALFRNLQDVAKGVAKGRLSLRSSYEVFGLNTWVDLAPRTGFELRHK
jgi:hypothetical protein